MIRTIVDGNVTSGTRRARPDDHADRQGQEERQDERPSGLQRVDLRSVDQQRQDERRKNDRADHQHHRQPDSDIALCHAGDLRHERRTGGQAQQRQALRIRSVQAEQTGHAHRQQWRDDEVREQRENDQPCVSERRQNLLQRQPRTGLGHARNEEDRNGKLRDGREEFSHRCAFTRPEAAPRTRLSKWLRAANSAKRSIARETPTETNRVGMPSSRLNAHALASVSLRVKPARRPRRISTHLPKIRLR
jgi:hypothetical protein